MSGANLSHSNLSQAKFYKVYLCKADLSQANLSGADLRGFLSGANLSEANLSGAKLTKARLGGANLSGANLNQANLSQVYLCNADLSGVSLNEADLSGADLSGANLSGADLSGANLSGVNLDRTNLNGANLNEAKLGIINTVIRQKHFTFLKSAFWSRFPSQVRRSSDKIDPANDLNNTALNKIKGNTSDSQCEILLAIEPNSADWEEIQKYLNEIASLYELHGGSILNIQNEAARNEYIEPYTPTEKRVRISLNSRFVDAEMSLWNRFKPWLSEWLSREDEPSELHIQANACLEDFKSKKAYVDSFEGQLALTEKFICLCSKVNCPDIPEELEELQSNVLLKVNPEVINRLFVLQENKRVVKDLGVQIKIVETI